MSAQTENSKPICKVGRLKKRADFLRLRKAKRYSTRHFTVQGATSADDGDVKSCRVGFTVTKKVGNAVERNRIKRRLRAAADTVMKHSARAGYDYAILAKRKTLQGSFDAIVQDLQQALDHLHANRAKGSG